MKNNIRITGGYLKGKNIPFDFKSSLRPTSSKLREVLFNWIQFEIKGMECLDLFAGTGALGIEALSRGAKKTIFIELNKKKSYLFGKDGVIKESEKQKLNFLAEIPILHEIPESSDAGIPLTSKENSCINEIFKKIADKLVKSISKNTSSEIKINN